METPITSELPPHNPIFLLNFLNIHTSTTRNYQSPQFTLFREPNTSTPSTSSATVSDPITRERNSGDLGTEVNSVTAEVPVVSQTLPPQVTFAELISQVKQAIKDNADQLSLQTPEEPTHSTAPGTGAAPESRLTSTWAILATRPRIQPRRRH